MSKHPGGRPSPIDIITPELVQILAEIGKTDAEMAKLFNVSERTFHTWKKKNEKFLHALKEGKTHSDAEVVKSLFERAKGWKDSNGREYPPDPVSMIFWLKNRQKEQWRDKHEISGDPNAPLIHTIERVIVKNDKKSKD